MIPDAIEWGEYQTVERHEGMYYSLITLTKNAAAPFAVPLALLLLDLTGYVPIQLLWLLIPNIIAVMPLALG
jgi:Na+/melibiose symporter-like transporter